MEMRIAHPVIICLELSRRLIHLQLIRLQLIHLQLIHLQLIHLQLIHLQLIHLPVHVNVPAALVHGRAALEA